MQPDNLQCGKYKKGNMLLCNVASIKEAICYYAMWQVFQISCYIHDIHHQLYEIVYHGVSMINEYLYSITVYT